MAHKLMEAYPHFAPAYNNLCQAEALAGNYDAAVQLAEQVLTFAPHNYQALANLARITYLRGAVEEATAQLTRLTALNHTDNAEYMLKLIETLTIFGDDGAVLASYAVAEQKGLTTPPEGQPLIAHLAAVAALGQGDEEKAKGYWQQALRLDPAFNLAQENLADLQKPIGERHAPWPYPINHWLPPQIDNGIMQLLKANTGNERTLTQAARHFCQQHPALNRILPNLLERGDPRGRQFAHGLICIAETPELLAILRDFALGQQGPDDLRVDAINRVVKAGLLPPGIVRMWIKGQWQEIILMNYEIHNEPIVTHAPAVVQLARAAVVSATEGKIIEAEALFKQALAIEPDSPDFLNNLAAICENQGRIAESQALVARIYHEFPDYFFGQINRVNQFTLQGAYREAHDLLKTLSERRRLHYSELDALCGAHIQLSLAEGDSTSAQTWFDLWTQVDEKNPRLLFWKERIAAAGQSPIQGYSEKLPI